MKPTLILLGFAWLAVLDITVALYDPFAITTKHHHNEQGGNKAKAYSVTRKGKKYSSKKGYRKKGKSHNFDKEKALKGEDGFSLHKLDDLEHAGRRAKFFADGFFKDFGHEYGGSSGGGNLKRAGHRKRKKYSKGFREKYSKNEQKKSSSFYSKGNKSGDYKLFGEENEKEGSEKGDENGGSNKHAAFEEDHYGKEKTKEKGHDQSESEGYTKKEGRERHHTRGKKYSKKGAKSKGGKAKAKGKYKYIPY